MDRLLRHPVMPSVRLTNAPLDPTLSAGIQSFRHHARSAEQHLSTIQYILPARICYGTLARSTDFGGDRRILCLPSGHKTNTRQANKVLHQSFQRLLSSRLHPLKNNVVRLPGENQRSLELFRIVVLAVTEALEPFCGIPEFCGHVQH